MKENKLLMPFISANEDHKYLLGFEAGKMYSKMQRNETFNNYFFHTENKEQIEMMCRRFHYTCRVEIINEHWISLFAELSAQVH